MKLKILLVYQTTIIPCIKKLYEVISHFFIILIIILAFICVYHPELWDNLLLSLLKEKKIIILQKVTDSNFELEEKITDIRKALDDVAKINYDTGVKGIAASITASVITTTCILAATYIKYKYFSQS